MVNKPVSESSWLGLSTDLGHSVVFVGRALHSHRASFHHGVYMGSGKQLRGPDKMKRSNL